MGGGVQNRIRNPLLQSLEQNIKMSLKILSKVKKLKKYFKTLEIRWGAALKAPPALQP